MKRAPRASHKVLGNRRKTIEGMKTRIKKKKKPTEVKILLQKVQKMSSVRKHSKDMDNIRTRELQPHK